jgi:catechol 2,3-dioxygenase-like lactoylglutathione lyase family enzyme
MTIRRAMPVVRTADLAASRAFYVEALGFEVAMRERGFLMLRSPSTPTTQLILAAEDAHDPGVREVDISMEVADVDAVHAEMAGRGLEVVRPLTDEPWGVRRFFVRDPDGLVVNVTSHLPPAA